MKKKNIYFIAAAGLFLIILLLGAYLIWAPKKSALKTTAPSAYQPEFLTTAEKQSLGLPADAKVQAFRDAKGGLEVYKIIKNDSQIVSDPSQIKPLSSRQK